MAIDMQGQKVEHATLHPFSPFMKGFHIYPWVIKIQDVQPTNNWTGISFEEIDLHNMVPTREGGNKEHLSIDVDMDGGMDVKMDYLVLLTIGDTNDDVINVVLRVVNDNVMAIVVLIWKSVSIEVVGNTCLPSSLHGFEYHLV